MLSDQTKHKERRFLYVLSYHRTSHISTPRGAAANEFLRSKIEEGVNAVLKAELAGFLGYEKHSSAGWNTGNSRNGSYQRTIVTSYGKITVDVPRDRNGEFQSPLLPTRKQRVDSLETTIIQLYQRGVTTRQIAELIEQMYGH